MLTREQKGWIEEILPVLQSRDIKKLNKILSRLTSEQFVSVLTIRIKQDMTDSFVFGKPLVRIIHELDYPGLDETSLKNLPDRLEQLNIIQFFSTLLEERRTRLVAQFRSGETWPTQFLYHLIEEKGFFYVSDRFHDFILTQDEVAFSARYQAVYSSRYTQEMHEALYNEATSCYEKLKQFPVASLLRPYFNNQKNIVSNVLDYFGLFAVEKIQEKKTNIKTVLPGQQRVCKFLCVNGHSVL